MYKIKYLYLLGGVKGIYFVLLKGENGKIFFNFLEKFLIYNF